MALSGDVNKIPALKLKNVIYITHSGLVSTEETDHRIESVAQVIDGSIDEVLHLIGYPNEDIQHLMDDDILRATDEVNAQLKQLTPRPPGSYLLQEKDRVFGVIIDSKSEPSIVGEISSVIPSEGTNGFRNTVMTKRDGNSMTCHSKDFNLRDLISKGVVFGMVGIGGFLFLQTQVSTPELITPLVLIQQNGYFFIEDSNVDWIRLKVGLRIGEMESNVTTLGPNECIVSRSGGCVRNGHRFQLFGSANAIIDFEAFLEMLRSMRTIPFPQNNANQDEEDKQEEYEADFATQKLSPDIDLSMESNASFYEDICEAYEQLNIMCTEDQVSNSTEEEMHSESADFEEDMLPSEEKPI